MNARSVSTIGLAQTPTGTGICQFYNLVKRGVSCAKIETLCMLLYYEFRCRERKILRCIALEIFKIVSNVNVYKAIYMIVMKQRSTLLELYYNYEINF